MSYNGVTVPRQWVISNNYPLSILKENDIDLRDIKNIREFFNNMPKKEYVKLFSGVEKFVKEHKEIKRFAIRSSQLYEDGSENSFSGLFYTELNLGNEGDIVNAIIKCWRESYNVGVIEYSKQNKAFQAVPCTVIIQQFIPSNKSGVIFRINNKIILDSNFGLAKSIVDGNTGCDEWIISNKTKKILKFKSNKELMNIPIMKRLNPNEGEEIAYQNLSNLKVKNFDNSNSILEVELTKNLRRKKSLDNNEINKIISTCEQVSNILNIKNYDIEWTYDDKGKLYILQCRPITKEFELINNTSRNGEYGIGLVNGEAIGKVSKVYDYKTAMNFNKRNILVTKRLSDSSLVAANKAIGCIIESKSPLSHSAIIARELGIPVIGNVDMDTIMEGSNYYINGKTGEYKIIETDISSNKNNIIKKILNKNITENTKKIILKNISSFKQDLFK